MTEALRDKLVRCGWVTPFNADTLVKLINKHCADVIRTAADQVVPEQDLDDVPGRFVNGCCHSQRQNTRADLLAIAAELEDGND